MSASTRRCSVTRMRPAALLLVLAALFGLGGVDGAGASGSGEAGAVRAVKEEIGNRWLLMETVPRALRSRGASASVDCDRVSDGRSLCSWSASNEFHDQVAEGFAVVVPRPGDEVEARLFASFCAAHEAQPCV